MDIYTKLSAQMEEMSASIHSRMAQHEEELKTASGTEASHKTIASLSRDFTEFKHFVCNTINALKSQVELLALGLDRHEMASRRKVLLLHGVSEDVEPLPSVIDTLTNKMELSDITASDIAACHRLGANKSKPRPLLIRFRHYSRRAETWNAKTMLKGSGLTLTEFLTKPRHKVFMDARRHFGVKQAWTSDGKIIIQLQNQKRLKIETAAELRDLIAKHPSSQPTDSVHGSKKPVLTQNTTSKVSASTSNSGKHRKPAK